MSERQRHQHGADGSPFGEVAAEPMADEVTEEGMDVDDVTAVARQRSLSRPESSRSLERRNSLLFRGQPSYIPPPTPDMSKLSRVLTQVFVWGRNDLGQLGMGNDTNLAQPTPCGALQNKGIVHITAGTFHTAAVSEDGDVWVFGANDSGQLGQRNGDVQLRPRRVAALEMHSVSHLAAGLSHSLAVTEKGQLLSWGAAEFGQLGQGADTDASVRVPKLVRGLQNPHLVRVAAGEAHSVFLDASGHVWSCGQGLFGALGHGSEEPLLQPKPVHALWNVAVVQVDCGNHHSAALALDGAIYTWGRGRYGALGLGNLENCYTPTKVRGVEGQHPLQLSCGNDHMLLLTKAGAVWSWGRGTWGQTGLGSVDDVCRPRRVPSLMDETVVQVSAGGRHSLMITRAGAVLACGCAEFGQLGPGVTQPFVATPRRVQQLPPGPPLFVVAGGDHCLLSVQEVHGRRALPPGPSAGQPYGLSLMALAELDLEGGIRSAASSPSEALRQERSLLLASVVGSVFSSPALIRHHFRRDAALAADLRAAPCAAGRCAQDHGLSLAAVSCTYTRLLKLYNVEIVEALCHAGTTALESAVAMLTESLQDQALQDSWLPALLVLSLNPVNGDSSGRGAVLMSLLNSVARLLTRRSRDTLAAWCAEVSKQHFSAYMLQPVQRNLTALVQDPHVLQEPLNVAGRKDLMKALSFMAVLHDANRLRRADAQLQFSDFYNSAVNATCNLQLEYILWRHRNYTQHVDSPLELYEPHMHRLSLCAFPFVLNALSKSRMMQGEAREMQNHAVRAGLDEQVIVQAMLHGVNPLAAAGFLDLRIRRENVLGDTLNQVASRPGDLSKPLRITFISNGVDEEGQDEGGVSKEFFMLLVRELFNPAFGMFTYDDQSRTFWFNQSSLETTREFQLVGSVMGLALYNGIILDVHFPLVVYKKLKGEAVGLADLEDFKPDVAKSFAQLLQYDGDVEKDLCLTFTVEYDYFGEKRTHELKPGGGSIAVSRANREEYAQLYCRYILEGSIAAQFNNFRDGFFRVVRGRTMHLFSHLELELLVCGLPHLDFKELEMNSRLDGGYSPDTPVVRWLWQVVHSFTIQQKKHFLLFTTGCDRAPVGGLKELRLVVQRSGPDTDRLPTSHTCFHVLLLPEYRSLEKLRRLLLMAIENAEGFGLK